MFRARLRRVSLPTSPRLTGARVPAARGYASVRPRTSLPAVPILRPVIWALATTAAIYLGCAAYDVRCDVQEARRRGYFKQGVRTYSYADLEAFKLHSHARQRSAHRSSSSSSPSPWQPTGQFGEMFAGHSNADKVILAASAVNLGLVGAKTFISESVMRYFSHIPCAGLNYTLLTCAFGHSGLFHVGLNTIALLQIGPNLTRSPVFGGNGSHFAAFYMSMAILSTLGDHIATALPTRTYRYNRLAPALGASGVAMAVIGAWATMYPDARVGVMLIPGTYTAQNVVACMAAFDLFGLFIGIPRLSLGHGAHLAGLALGSAYVHWNGPKHIWRPARKLTYGVMNSLRIV